MILGCHLSFPTIILLYVILYRNTIHYSRHHLLIPHIHINRIISEQRQQSSTALSWSSRSCQHNLLHCDQFLSNSTISDHLRLSNGDNRDDNDARSDERAEEPKPEPQQEENPERQQEELPPYNDASFSDTRRYPSDHWPTPAGASAGTMRRSAGQHARVTLIGLKRSLVEVATLTSDIFFSNPSSNGMLSEHLRLSNGDNKGDVEEQKTEEKPEEPQPEQKLEQEPAEEMAPRRSRIETYDEFARFRDSSRPPDSHYPPGPVGGFKRSSGTMTSFSVLIILLWPGMLVLFFL